jgi:hypothetical protein
MKEKLHFHDASKYKNIPHTCTKYAVKRLTGFDMPSSENFVEGESESTFYTIEKFAPCKMKDGDVTQLNEHSFKNVILRIISKNNRGHSIILRNHVMKDGIEIIQYEDQYEDENNGEYHEIEINNLAEMWSQAGNKYAICTKECFTGNDGT